MRFLLSGCNLVAVCGVLLLALMVVPASGAMSAPMNARDLTGTNMPGIDHWNTFVNSAQECSDLCDTTPGCEGATYVLPNTIQGANGHCWRKSVVTGDVENFNCISFLRQSVPSGGGCFGVKPAAGFSAFPVSGSAPYAVQFTDQSTGAVSWTWDFGDLTSGSDNTQQNPLHIYSTGNAQGITYTVKLTITGSCPGQTDTKTRTGYITVYDNIGVLNLTSVPGGARVYLDALDVGTTPYKNLVPAGAHNLRLTMSGYNDYTTSVTVIKNQQNKVTATLVKATTTTATTTTATTSIATTSTAPATGTLQVTTTPDGAAVYVDGGSRGTSPKTIAGLTPGSHTVKLTKTGYIDYQGTVTVQAGQTTPLNVKLVAGTSPSAGTTTTAVTIRVPTGTTSTTLLTTTTPVPASQAPAGTGTLTVRSTPAGASVYLDGEKAGTTPARIQNVTAGTHRLLLALQGYGDISQTVSVTGGTDNEVSADFTTGKKTPGFGMALPLAAVALTALVMLLGRKDR